ncbi:hypothetical protein [Nocardia altamirensis]|uniref:hypothetical protein n=1 Tax=Nocardia altamirensis TaxID=472158 RepID=UPI001C3F6BF6|nr:hypothetical protein [Nocardia altamirensis]
MKPSQVGAAALAAVTAAFLGSTLGVAGTVAGAGIASVVSTVGGEFYLRSFRRTKDAALALADSTTRQQTELTQPPPQTPEQRTADYHPAAPGRAGRRNDRLPGPGAGHQPPWGQRPPTNTMPPNSMPSTNRIPPHTIPPGGGAGRFVDADRTVVIPQVNRQLPVGDSGSRAAQQRRGYNLRWPLIIGTSVAAFLIAILAITGFEGATGKSISGNEVANVGHWWTNDGSGQPDNPPTGEDDGTVQPSQSQVPTTTSQNGSSTTKSPTSTSSTPSTSVPKQSTSVPSSSAGTLTPSAPSTNAPEASKTPRTQNSPPSNSNNTPGNGNTPGTGTQRSGSGGGAGDN